MGKDGKYINNISLGKYIFIKYWSERHPAEVNSGECKSDFFGIYDFAREHPEKEVAFSYFISNMIFSILNKKVHNRLWLLFPVRYGKEFYRDGTACLNATPDLRKQNGTF